MINLGFLKRVIQLGLFLMSVLTLTGCNESNIYEVSFVVGDQEIVLNVQQDELIEIPKVMIPEGYEFDGWYLDNHTFLENGQSVIEQPIEKNLRFYAKLDPVFILVQFLDEEGNLFHEYQKGYYHHVTYPVEEPVKEGYVFDEWKKIHEDENLVIFEPNLKKAIHSVIFYDFEGKIYCEQDVIHGEDAIVPVNPEYFQHVFIGWNQDLSNITENIAVYPIFEPLLHEVIFLDDNDEVFDMIKVLDATKIIYPEHHPEKEGYSFIGWSVSYQTWINDNTIVYPIFEPKIYTLVFFDHDGELFTTRSGAYQEEIIYPVGPYLEGYNFERWDYNQTYFSENKGVYPTYKIKSYSISYQDEDGYVYQTFSVNHNDVIPQIDSPTKPHHLFVSWDCNNVIATSDLIFTAIFEPVNYQVVFHDSYGERISTQLVTYLSGAVEPESPMKTGYVFTGWNQDFSRVDKDLLIYPIYEIASYKLSFETNGGNDIPLTYIVYQEEIDLPLEPKKYGFSFGGWYNEDLTEVFDLKIMPAEDLVLYAHWIPNEVLVTVIVDDHHSETFEIDYGGLYSDIHLTTKKGYTLIGFSHEGLDGVPMDDQETVKNCEEHVVYALWEANEYQISFVLGSDDALISEDHIWLAFNEKYANMPLPTRIGYSFAGWTLYDGTEVNQDTLVLIDNDHVVYANWEINQYQVTLIYDDLNQVTHDLVFNSVLEMPTRIGYTFIGWYEDLNDTEAVVNVPGRDVILYADWTLDTYQITYHMEGGDNSANNPNQYTYIDVIEFDVPTRIGYRFVGWYYDVLFTEQVDMIERLTEDIEIYAAWEPISYTIVYLSNSYGNASGSMSNQDINYDDYQQIQENGYSFPGLIFKGWATSPQGQVVYQSGDMVKNLSSNESEVYLYAVWNARINYYSTPSRFYQTREFRYNTSFSDYPELTKEFYEFDGWYTHPSEGEKLFPSSIVTRSMTVYARFNEGEEWRDYHRIYNAADFLMIQEQPDQNYVIMNDINFNNMDIAPIENFSGILFGLNATLSNYHVTTFVNGNTSEFIKSEYYGVFYELTGVMKNIVFSGSVTVSNSTFDSNKEVLVGGVVALNRGTMINIHHTGIIEVKEEVRNTIVVGGVTSINYGSMSHSSNSGTINLLSKRGFYIFAGGVVAVTYTDISFISNTGTINVDILTNRSSWVGGLIGRINQGENPVELKNSFNKGAIKVVATTPASTAHASLSVGGLVGSSTYTNIISCYNSGVVDATYYASNRFGQFLNLGGIIGYVGDHDIASIINHTYNVGDLKATSGTTYDNGSVTMYVGGLVGRTSTITPAIIKNSYVAFTNFTKEGGRSITIITGGIIGNNNYTAGSNLHWEVHAGTIASNTASTITTLYSSIYDMRLIASKLNQEDQLGYWIIGSYQTTPTLTMNN